MIGVTVDVKDRAIITRFEQLPQFLQAALLPVITLETRRLYAMVIANEPIRTGKLRASTQMFIDQGRDFIRGRVRIIGDKSTIHAKAGALEYGAHSSVRVAAHGMMLGHVFDQMLDARLVMVEAYSRHVNLPALRFMRNAISAVRGEAIAAIQKAIDAEISRAHAV